MQTLLGAQLLSDLTLARIRTLNRFYSPPTLPVSNYDQTNQSVLRNARPLIFTAAALVASGIVYQGRFTLSLVTGFNNNLAIRYVQFFDQPTVPVNPQVPIQSIPVNPQQEFSWSPSQDGLIFERACSFGLSTTAMTFTAAAADLYLRVEGLVL
jgi:hypothetical protein